MRTNKLTKFALSLSCFLPLYIIFMIKNVVKILAIRQDINATDSSNLCPYLQKNLCYNKCLTIIWFILIIIAIVGIISFTVSFLDSKKRSKDSVILLKAENITAEYYFTYFSLFVLTFFTIDPTELCNFIDVIILAVLFLLLIVVYIMNDMYFINPVLNILGYRSFSIEYVKESSTQNQDNLAEVKHFDAKVFSRNNLVREVNKSCYIKFSAHDFSILHVAGKNV